MGERRTFSMALTKPKSFATKKGGTGFEFHSLDGESFTCFDQAFVDAFTSNNLAGVVREYSYETADDPKWKPALRSIPGLYEGQARRPGGGGGGFRSGPMLSDAQAALLFAAGSEDFEARADRALAWLRSQGPAPSPASSTAAPESNGSAESSRAGTTPITNGNGVGEHLLTLAADAFPGRPKLAEAWLRGQARQRGAASVPELSEAQVAEVEQTLEQVVEERNR